MADKPTRRPGGGGSSTESMLAQQQREQREAVEAYVDTHNLLVIDNISADTASIAIAQEQLREKEQNAKRRSKAMKDKCLLISAENVSKKELTDSLTDRLESLSEELNRLSMVEHKLRQPVKNEDEKTKTLEVLFESTLERAVAKRNDASMVKAAPKTQQLDEGGLPSTAISSVRVYYCPGGEDAPRAVSSQLVRFSRTTTFRHVNSTAARFFGHSADMYQLEDEHETLWPPDLGVHRAIARRRGREVLRLVRRRERDMTGDIDIQDDIDHESEEAGVGTLLKMLDNDTKVAEGAAAATGAPGDAGGGEDADPEAEQQAAAMEALAALDDESDSDDDNIQRKEYVEPPIKMRRELRDLFIHLIFLGLLIVSTSFRRNIVDANAVFNAMETIFIEEAFGDFNEKAFMDVRNFEEAWEWTEGVLMAGLFESDVDDTKNIMMYNQLVGAVRLRQQRVTNDSCTLSTNIQRRVAIGETEFTYSLYYPAPMLGDGGSCYGNYNVDTRDNKSFGPCTEFGRSRLQAVPNYQKYNQSCEGSGFEWWPANRTKATGISFNDASGYVRDILPDEAPPGRDTPRMNPQTFQDTIDELKNFLWLDEQTRSYIISFSIYNANFNLYGALNFVFEFTPGGILMPRYLFKIFKLELYDGIAQPTDALTSMEVILDVLVNLLVIRLLLKEIVSLIYIRCVYGTSLPYFTNIWNLLELTNITPFAFAWFTRLSFQFDENRVLYKKGMFATRYGEISSSADAYALAFNFDSISILVSFLKLFKYFRLHPAFAILWNVLSRAGKDMGFFFFMLGLFLAGFVIYAEQLYGSNLRLYSSVIDSATALLQMIFGVVDVYYDMIESNAPGMDRYLVAAFFIGYVVWMFFILVNVFLAILNDNYGAVMGEKAEAEELARIEREEKIASGELVERGFGDRISALRKAARGRLHRFESRLSRLARRRKKTPLSEFDAIASATAHHLNEEEERLANKKRRRRRKKAAAAEPE